jgi:hypothetical protein
VFERVRIGRHGADYGRRRARTHHHHPSSNNTTKQDLARLEAVALSVVLGGNAQLRDVQGLGE